MAQEMPPATGVGRQANLGMRAEGGAHATARLMVAVVLFIVLAGIFSCLWVPPSRGF